MSTADGMAPPAAHDPQPRRPSWGVRLPVRKVLSTRQPILIAPLPSQVTMPLGTQAAAPGIVAGGRVYTGQPISAPGDPRSPRVHASISGRIVAVEDRHVAGVAARVPCVVIESDGRDEPWPALTPIDPASLDREAIRDRVAEAGIVGLGGALFPTAVKLSVPHPVETLLLNGAECEPYISCDDMLIRERAARILQGGRILMNALDARRCIIAVKTDMPEARIALWNALNADGDPRIGMSVVTARYPAGGERQLIELVLGREVPEGGLPADVGVVCQNVGTAAAVADYFLDARPLIARIVTVNGGAIAAPRNIEARIGTPLRELVAAAGGYSAPVASLVMGGPMMGVGLSDDALPMTAAVNCVMALTDEETGIEAPELPCIRCGDCVEVCPAHLMPLELWFATRREDIPALDTFGVVECIQCGACNYVCPSHIPLVQHFIVGKQLLADARYADERARVARTRFEARTARLDRQTEENRRALEAADLTSVEDALSRARQHQDKGE